MSRSNVVLLLVFTGLFVYWFAFERSSNAGVSAPTTTLVLFPEFDPNTVERLEISETQKVFPQAAAGAEKPAKTEPEDKLVTLALKKSGDQWVVETSGDYPAKPDKVKDAISKVQSFRRGDSYSSNPASYAKFGVDDKGKRVKAFGPGGKQVADFFVGKAGHGVHSTFIRSADSKDVLLVDEPLAAIFATYKNNWFDNAILPAIDPKNVATCEVTWNIPPAADAPAGTAPTPTTGGITLVRKGDKDWEASAPESYKAKWNLAEGFVRSLTTIRFEDVVKPTAAEAGFDQPTLHALVTMTDGAKHELFAGAKTKDGKIHLKKGGSDYTFLGNAALIENLPKRIDGLREVPEAYGPPLPPETKPTPPSSIRDWMFEQRFKEAPIAIVGKLVTDEVAQAPADAAAGAFKPSHRRATFEVQEIFKAPDAIKQGGTIAVNYWYVDDAKDPALPLAAFEANRSYVLFLGSAQTDGGYKFASSPDTLFFDWLADNPLREKGRALAGK